MSVEKKDKETRFTAADWPAEGHVVDGFCIRCHSHFCPHANPGLYEKRDYSKLDLDGGEHLVPKEAA